MNAPGTPFRIFLNYRRGDAQAYARLVVSALRQRWPGNDQIFFDIDTIEAGRDFTEAIGRAVGQCDVLVALVGKGWATATDASGRSRLENPDDYVRVEIEAALDRDVRVIPSLVGGADLPSAEDVPDSLRRFLRRNALELTDRHWEKDVQQLVEVLGRIEAERGLAAEPVVPRPSPLAAEPREPSRHRLLLVGAAAALVAVVAAGYLAGRTTRSGSTPPPRTLRLGTVIVPYREPWKATRHPAAFAGLRAQAGVSMAKFGRKATLSIADVGRSQQAPWFLPAQVVHRLGPAARDPQFVRVANAQAVRYSLASGVLYVVAHRGGAVLLACQGSGALRSACERLISAARLKVAPLSVAPSSRDAERLNHAFSELRRANVTGAKTREEQATAAQQAAAAYRVAAAELGAGSYDPVVRGSVGQMRALLAQMDTAYRRLGQAARAGHAVAYAQRRADIRALGNHIATARDRLAFYGFDVR